MAVAGCGPRPVARRHAPVTGLTGLTITFLDLGRGSAALMQWADYTALLDAGTETSAPKLIAELRRRRVDHLDWLITTNSNPEYIGGVPAVFQAFPVDRVLDSGYDAGSDAEKKMVAALKAHPLTRFVAAEGENTEDLGGGAALYLLAPLDPELGGTPNDAANNSTVARLMYGKTRILLTGGMQEEERRAIYTHLPSFHDWKDMITANVLQLPDHGSRAGTDAEFLDMVKPTLAICNGGNGPDAAVVSDIHAAKVKLYRTDQNGNVTLTTDGVTAKVSTSRT